MSTIDPTVKTSRTFDALVKLHDALGDATFPASVHGTTPTLCFHKVPIDRAGEFIAVLVNEEASAAEWVELGPASQQERFTIDVAILSNLRAQHDGKVVVQRLEALADVVQGVVWDSVNNKPKALGFTNERRIGRWGSVTPALYELDTGIVGTAVVSVACTAQV